jgi:hypothetical protein
MGNEMNCEQLQEILPHVIDEGGNAEADAHLASCASCGELAHDLKHIATQAGLLLPMHDPSPRVWSNIQQSLVSEGLIRGGRMPGPAGVAEFPKRFAPPLRAWTPLGSFIAAAAVLLLGFVLFRYNPSSASTQAAIQPAASGDQQLISQISKGDPSVGKAYEESLKQVNSYIADAEKAAKDNGEDAFASEQLMDAYQQKAMLYEMAAARSTE